MVARKKRRWKTALTAALCVLLVAVIAVVGISFYVGWQLTHPAREPIKETPGDYGLDYTEVDFASRADGVPLKGWFVPAAGGNKGLTVIMAHGYRNNRAQQNVPGLQVAERLSKEGFDLFMFDFRGHGESGGKFVSVGQHEMKDLLGAIDWVRQQGTPGQPVALLGFSMGASTSLMAAAAEPAVAGVVADSPFSNLYEYLQENLSVWSNLPNFPFTPTILAIMPPLLDVDPKAVDPRSAVDDIYPRPILFIHSVEDGSIPYTESERMWQRHPDRFQFWKADSGDHVRVFKTSPEEYMERVTAFLNDLAQAGR
jgi:fermentation-respiration switch protein FrsA (DUF1100 family)